MRISDWSSDVCSSDLAFTQILLADLLGRGLRQRGDEFDVARHHERGQLLIAPGDQRSRFDALTFTQHDEGHDLVLAGILLRTYPYDAAFRDGRVGTDTRLDLERRDILSSPTQRILHPIHEKIPAFRIPAHRIPSVEPQVSPRLDGLFRHAQILESDDPRHARTHQQLALFAIRHRFAGFRIGQLYLEPLVRSEEHTSELQSLIRISYAVFCLKK